MAAYTTYTDGSSTISSAATAPLGAPGVTFFTAEFDASKRNLTTSDSAQIFSLPAGVYVEDVFVEILTADDGGGAITVGDGTAADAYGTYATLSSTGKLAIAAGSATTNLYTVTTNAKLKPKYITSANDKAISLNCDTASVTTLKMKVTVKAVRV